MQQINNGDRVSDAQEVLKEFSQIGEYLSKRTSLFANDYIQDNKITVMAKGSFVYQFFVQQNIQPKDIDLEIILEEGSLQKTDGSIETMIVNLFQLENSPLHRNSIWRGRRNNEDVKNINFSLPEEITHLPLSLDITIRDRNHVADHKKDWVANFDKLRIFFDKDGEVTLRTCDGSNSKLLLRNLAKEIYYTNNNGRYDQSFIKRLRKYEQEGFTWAEKVEQAEQRYLAKISSTPPPSTAPASFSYQLPIQILGRDNANSHF